MKRSVRMVVALTALLAGCATSTPPRSTSNQNAIRALAEGIEPAPRRTRQHAPTQRSMDGTLDDEDPRVGQDDSPYDDYPIWADAGWRVVIELSSDDFDTYLFLNTPDGNALIQDDDGGGDLNSRIDFTVPEAGDYVVRANSYDASGRGRYHLEYRVGPPTDPMFR